MRRVAVRVSFRVAIRVTFRVARYGFLSIRNDNNLENYQRHVYLSWKSLCTSSFSNIEFTDVDVVFFSLTLSKLVFYTSDGRFLHSNIWLGTCVVHTEDTERALRV